jgi:uncharacterized protein DUF6516
MPTFSRADYENVLYSLIEQYPEVTNSTLRLYPNSATTAFSRGSVYFHNGLELRVFEYLDLTDGELLDYSYTVLRGEERVRWYDPQPHPELTELALTFPHHRHEPPDIKQNRRPTPGITFHVPNLPTLIADCIELGKTLGGISSSVDTILNFW